MKPIYVFRHIDCEGPGYLAQVLDRMRIAYRIVAIDEGDSVPENPDGMAALVFMGGPMSVNDPLPWIAQELELIRAAVDRDLPVLGHCLGGQLIGKALGGTVGPNRVKEIGWHAVEPVTGDGTPDWVNDLPAGVELFHWHGETFSLPEGAMPILRSQWCEHQGFVIGKTIALQCHVEMTAAMVREWAARYAHELRAPSESVQSADQMVVDLDPRIARAQHTADTLYSRWLQQAGFAQA